MTESVSEQPADLIGGDDIWIVASLRVRKEGDHRISDCGGDHKGRGCFELCCGLVGLIRSKREVLIGNAVATERPYNWNVERLDLVRNSEVYGTRQPKLLFGQPELVQVLLSFIHSYVSTILFRALNPSGTSNGFKCEKSPAQLGKESWRQESIGDGTVIAVADAAQVGARPVE